MKFVMKCVKIVTYQQVNEGLQEGKDVEEKEHSLTLPLLQHVYACRLRGQQGLVRGTTGCHR